VTSAIVMNQPIFGLNPKVGQQRREQFAYSVRQ
jgi:hypothetical protein